LVIAKCFSLAPSSMASASAAVLVRFAPTGAPLTRLDYSNGDDVCSYPEVEL